MVQANTEAFVTAAVEFPGVLFMRQEADVVCVILFMRHTKRKHNIVNKFAVELAVDQELEILPVIGCYPCIIIITSLRAPCMVEVCNNVWGDSEWRHGKYR